MRFQCKLSVRVMTECLAMHWQEMVSMFVAHITISKHGDVSGMGSHRGRLGCQVAVYNGPSLDAELWRAGLISH